MSIGLSIRVGLAKKNQKQVWLIKKSGLSKNYVSKICNDLAMPSYPTIIDLAIVFDVKVSVFISWGES